MSVNCVVASSVTLKSSNQTTQEMNLKKYRSCNIFLKTGVCEVLVTTFKEEGREKENFVENT